MKLSIFKISLCIFFLISTTSKAQNTYKLGDVVNDFSLKNIDGKVVSMANYTNVNGFIVVFYSEQCPLSLAYEDRMIALNVKYATKGFQVLAINPNDITTKPNNNFEIMIASAKNKVYTFPYLFDENQEVSAAFGAKSTPQVYLLQNTKKGFILAYTGLIDNDIEDINSFNSIKYVENAVNQLIAGKKITINQTNFMGCPINYKAPAQ